MANVDQVDWSQLPDIRELNLGFNFITDMTPLTKLKHLKSLNLRNNFLTDVPIMADDYKSLFRYLKKLDLSGNRISDLTVLQIPVSDTDSALGGNGYRSSDFILNVLSVSY